MHAYKKTNLFRGTGIVIALLTTIFIASWAFNELSYDRHFKKADRIYRFSVEQNDKERNFYWHFARSWQTWRRELPEYFPEVEALCELAPVRKASVRIEENKFYNEHIFASDSSFFKVFDVEFVVGDRHNAINNANTVIVSESFAKKHFGNKTRLAKT
ncbi:MAG: ABC transporter permease [Bacteroidales bacterium]|nr:ABC transporter permease [Bacteroidales bacterium]